MTDRCPACGGIRVLLGQTYVGDAIICHCLSSSAFGTKFIDPTPIVNLSSGWICAKCGASYAPWVYRCEPCSQPKTFIGTSTKAQS